MTFISPQGNICIPDRSMIKESTDHHLLTIQPTKIWPGGVYTGRRIHAPAWHDPKSGAASFHRQSGWAGYHLCPFSPNHQEGRRLTSTATAECTQTYCYSHTRTMPLQIQAQHLFQSESTPLPETCSKNEIKARERRRNERKERHMKRKTRGSLFPCDIQCFLWHAVSFSEQLGSDTALELRVPDLFSKVIKSL